MKSTGIIRRIDDLGRVVIPKEIRRIAKLREGDPMEIYVDRNGEITLKKYSPVAGLGEFAQKYADSLHEATGYIALIADCDVILAAAGAPLKNFLGIPISTHMEAAIENRKTIMLNNNNSDQSVYQAMTIAPIIVEGDITGTVSLLSLKPDTKMSDMEIKLSETAANFLAKQMTL